MAIRSLCVTLGADRPTIETFIGMHKAGIDVTAVCPSAHTNFSRLIDAGVPTIDIAIARNFDRGAQKLLRAELARGRFHIVHAFNSPALTNSLAAAKGLSVKVIAYRGIVGNVSYLDPMSWARYLNPRIDRIVCVCDAIRDWFLNMQPAFLRMPATRPVTIYKGHKLEWYDEEPADLEAEGIPPDAFVIGCAAAYRPRKGIDYLIDALERLPADIPAHLLLVGHMEAPALTRRINRSPARDRIHRIGFRKNAPAYSGACDVFCLPSTKREGLPRAVIEAMVYSVPPVVTDCGGSPELVDNGKTGLVVPVRDAAALANAFETLYRNADRRQAMGQAARRRIAEHFNNDLTVQRTIALYEELVPMPD